MSSIGSLDRSRRAPAATRRPDRPRFAGRGIAAARVAALSGRRELGEISLVCAVTRSLFRCDSSADDNSLTSPVSLVADTPSTCPPKGTDRPILSAVGSGPVNTAIFNAAIAVRLAVPALADSDSFGVIAVNPIEGLAVRAG